MPPSPQQRQADLIARYAIIPDPHERLAALITRRQAVPVLPAGERTEENLVQGCQSRVWIAGHYDTGTSAGTGRCRFRMEAESAMVKGLVALLCELYDDATPGEILAVEPEIFESLGIARNLTPTRLNGLAGVRAHLRRFAEQVA